MFLKSFEKYECTACTACLNACPQHCIKMQNDEEGFAYPFVEEEKCVKCGLCERVCPYNHIIEKSDNAKVYAGYLRDQNERKKSSSGGLFYAVACWIIRNGGVVFGATIDNNLQVYHIGVSEIAELAKLRGSKYVQSRLGDIFVQVKDVLIQNRWCYFVGTGCQVAGLKSYLKKDYPNLITSDLVCHGVPSQMLFDEHISYLTKKYNSNIFKYEFRDNEKWGGCEIIEIQKKGKKKIIKKPTYYKSPYLNAFMSNFVLRYSCYKCQYATSSRVGDITLADYWGVENIISDIDTKNGVSMMIVNTPKGELIKKNIEECCKFWESNMEDAKRYNSNLTINTEMNQIRTTVFQNIKDKGYDEVATTIFKSNKYFKSLFLGFLLSNRFIRSIIIKIKGFK